MSNDETLGETWRATDQLSDITDVKQRKYKHGFDLMIKSIQGSKPLPLSLVMSSQLKIKT